MPETLGDALIPDLVRMRLAGMNQTTIARNLGVLPQTVGHTLRRADVRALIDDANRESYAAIMDQRGALAMEALERLAEVMRDEAAPHAVRRQACVDILDRCGITKEVALRFPDGPPVQVALVGLSPEQLQALAWGEAPRVLDVVPGEAK